MLESMRNQAQSWLAKVMLTGIALSFVLWGVGDYFFGGGAEPVATINGKPVGSTEFYQAYERQLGAYRSMLGKNYSKELVNSMNVKGNTLQTIINRRVMLNVAHELGLAAPESVLLSTVRNNPSFQSAGAFDPKRYQILTRNMGFGSAQDYENDLRLNIVVDALQKAIVGSVQISDSEIRDRFNHDYEQRVLAAIIVDPVTQMDHVKISDEQAKAWYETHKNNYQSLLRIKVNAVEINPRDLAQEMSVDESEIRAAYDSRKSEFAEPEQRKASHILMKVAKGSSEDVYAAARKKIESVQARIKAGEDFAKLAKEVSDDISNAGKGGDLGWFKAGMMVPEFDQVVFSMDKGDVSDVVETQFGFHLIYLTDVRPARQTPYADVKGKLRDELIQARANDEAYRLSQDLDNALGMEDSLKSAAESLDLKVFTSDLVNMDDAEVTPLLSDVEIRSKAFATLPGQAVEIAETGDGRFIAFEVTDRQEPDVLPYEKVARKVLADARLDAANNKARELADTIRASKDKSLDELAQQYGQAKYISKPVRSNGVGDQATWLTKDVLNKVFMTASGAWLNQSMNVPQGYAAVRIEKAVESSDEEFAKQKANIAKQVQQAKGAVRFARWMASVREGYEVVTNEKELARY
ncbi:MAG: SurA N-terminal domain-containing protein [Mariprofundus sp.]|nr:SurA N-terminal domain-containing protein [Mariprofundus sp.]